jgi:hypothetical protein
VSTVVYARVPDSLKQALAARARERDLSLTAAVVALLERGLDASEEERAREREGELAASASELERTRARLAEAEAALELARGREQITASTYRALAERARGALASCPQCKKPLRGSDLLVSGHCPQCARPITALLLPRPQTGAPDRDAYLALLGALGGLVGLALATTSGGAGQKRPGS